MSKDTKNKGNKTIDLDDILNPPPPKVAEVPKPPIYAKASEYDPPNFGWGPDDKLKPWEKAFSPITVAAIKAAARARGLQPETFIELAILRQVAEYVIDTTDA